jgi:hypothetical protein
MGKTAPYRQVDQLDIGFVLESREDFAKTNSHTDTDTFTELQQA